MSKSYLLATLCFAAGMSAGCGYTLVGQASNIPTDVRRVYIEPLDNATQRAQVEQILTQAISDEMVTRRRNFTVSSNVRDADAILRGTVTGFDVRAVTFDENGLANNFEITITADMRFERPPRAGEDEGETLWNSSRYFFREDYPLEEDDGAAYFDRENLAIEETSVRFAESMVTDLLEGF